MTTPLGVKGFSTLPKLPSYITLKREALRADTITLPNLVIENTSTSCGMRMYGVVSGGGFLCSELFT